MLFVFVTAGLLLAQASIDSVWFWEETECNDSNIVTICYEISGTAPGVTVVASPDSGITRVAIGCAWFTTLFDTAGDLGTCITDTTPHCFDWLISEGLPNIETRDWMFELSIKGAQNTSSTWFETDSFDFSDGDTSRLKIIDDDDSSGTSALYLPPGNDTIYVLQVYPDGHCTSCMSHAIYDYMHDGTPSLNIKTYLLTISEFNAFATDSISILNCSYIDLLGVVHTAIPKCLKDFDVLVFGIADSYGGTGNDLTVVSADAVRNYCYMGKGLLLTHDTAACGSGFCMYNFCALTEISGVSCMDSRGTDYDEVYRITTMDLPILNTPFAIPDTFPVLYTHWKGQILWDGEILYRGIGTPSSVNDNLLYWYSYHNSTYNSFSNFFSYGHTEAIPMEWESKAMINCIYNSYHGGIGTGVYESSIHSFDTTSSLNSIAFSIETPGSSSATIEIAIDTCIDISDTCWSEWFSVEDSSIYELVFDCIKYRVGMTHGVTDSSPMFHWIRFNFGEKIVDTTYGPIDSRPPVVNIFDCPDSIIPDSSYIITWEVNDTFWNDDSCRVICQYGSLYPSIETTTSSLSYVWTAPSLFEVCTLIVAARDSFCNWGYDTCFMTCDTSTGIAEIDKPKELNIHIEPNPFNSTVSINAPEGSEIMIFDIEGRKIKKFTGGSQVWKPEPSVGSGVYLVYVFSEEYETTIRVIYLK